MSIEKQRTVIFVMGVSGSGKSTIGKLLAKEMGYIFIEGDDYHPEANIKKMSAGIPLTDEDRMPWLLKLNALAIEHRDFGCVITCSALKQSYRQLLAKSIEENVRWIYLEGSYELIYNRMQKRLGHFMNPEMLQSQFDDLEAPENALAISIDDSQELILEKIKNSL